VFHQGGGLRRQQRRDPGLPLDHGRSGGADAAGQQDLLEGLSLARRLLRLLRQPLRAGDFVLDELDVSQGLVLAPDGSCWEETTHSIQLTCSSIGRGGCTHKFLDLREAEDCTDTSHAKLKGYPPMPEQRVDP
jgi:hypothetical protein